MTNLTQTQNSQDLLQENYDLHLTDWRAYFTPQPISTMYAELHSVEVEADAYEMPVPVWTGVVVCSVAEPTKEAVVELIRSHQDLSADKYHIAHVWQPANAEEF